MSAYEVLALVLGSLVARELMAMGLKSITNKNGKNSSMAKVRMDNFEKDLEEIKEDIKNIRRVVLKIAIKLKIDEKDLGGLV